MNTDEKEGAETETDSVAHDDGFEQNAGYVLLKRGGVGPARTMEEWAKIDAEKANGHAAIDDEMLQDQKDRKKMRESIPKD